MNKRIKILMCIFMLLLTLTNTMNAVASESVKAKFVPSSFYLDTGEGVELILVGAYKLDGVKYYSLEDIAYAFSNTEHKASVTIEKSKAIIKSGKKQKLTNTTYQAADNKTYKVAKATMTFDGKALKQTAYLIDGKICSSIDDIATIFNILLANGGVNRMKFYAGIDHPSNVDKPKKGIVTSDWEDGLYGIQFFYAPEAMATVSYGSVDYGANIVVGNYSDNPKASQLFVLRKTRTWQGYQLYSMENINSYMLISGSYDGDIDNIWQGGTLTTDYIFESGKDGGTYINMSKSSRIYIGTWDNAKHHGTWFASTKTPTAFNIIRY